MFGEIVRNFRKSKIAVSVHRLLLKNYQLQANLDGLNRYVFRWAEYHSNPHELAVSYIAMQISLMDKADPQHVTLATRYIRVAQRAYEIGEAIDRWALDELREQAGGVLGIVVQSK